MEKYKKKRTSCFEEEEEEEEQCIPKKQRRRGTSLSFIPDGDNEDFSKEKNKVTAIMSKMVNRVKVLFNEFLLIPRTLDL